MQQFNIKSENVVGHKEFPNVKKTCPGKNINLEEIRNILKQITP